MSKASKNKNGKVPKITEAEYAAYVLSLKSAEESLTPRADERIASLTTDQKTENQG